MVIHRYADTDLPHAVCGVESPAMAECTRREAVQVSQCHRVPLCQRCFRPPTGDAVCNVCRGTGLGRHATVLGHTVVKPLGESAFCVPCGGTGERRVIEFAALQRMVVEQVDKLPSPAEFRVVVKGRTLRIRKQWVGFGWVGAERADGTEPLLVVEGA